MSYGQLAQFMVYAAIVGSAGASLTEMWGEIQRAAGAMERLRELLEARPSICAPPRPLAFALPYAAPSASDNVTFHYPRVRRLRRWKTSISTWRRAKPSLSLDPQARARARHSNCLLRSTTPMPVGL